MSKPPDGTKSNEINMAFAKSMSIQLPHPEDRDWPVFILRSLYVVMPTFFGSIGASYAAHLSLAWTIVFACAAAGPTFLGTLIGFMTDARRPGSRTRSADRLEKSLKEIK